MPAERKEPSRDAIQFDDILSCVLPLSTPRKWARVVWPDELAAVLITAYEDGFGKTPDLSNRREVKQALQIVVPAALRRWVRATDMAIHYVAVALVWFQYVQPLLADVDAPQNLEVQERLENHAALADCYRALGLPADRLKEFCDKVAQAYQLSLYADFKSLGIQRLWDSVLGRVSTNRFAPGPLSTEGLVRRTALLAEVMACIDTACARRLPIVLHGPPASGKRSLLKLLANEPDILTRWSSGPTLLALGDAPHTADDLQQLITTRLGGGGFEPKVVFIDNCAAGMHAQVVLDLMPAGSLVVVTTCHSRVVHELVPSDATVVSVGPFTRDETEAFYRAVWRANLAADELPHLHQVHDLVRGNPLGLRLALHYIKVRGWNETLRALCEPPLPTPLGVTAELFQPLHLAYQLLAGQNLLNYGVRLGALLPLEEYDTETFAALWEMTPGRAGDILALLERDAGLISRRSPTGWDIHPQVLGYAASLLAQSPHEEQGAAQQWLDRLAAEVLLQKQYREFRARQPRLTLRAILKMRAEAQVPIEGALLRRVWRELRHPNTVAEWQTIQNFSENFTSKEIGLAYQLRAEERCAQRLLVSGIVGSLGLLLLVSGLLLMDLIIKDFVLLYYPCALLLLIGALVFLIALAFRIVLVDLAREPAWLALWRQARLRQGADNAPSQDEAIMV